MKTYIRIRNETIEMIEEMGRSQKSQVEEEDLRREKKLEREKERD